MPTTTKINGVHYKLQSMQCLPLKDEPTKDDLIKLVNGNPPTNNFAKDIIFWSARNQSLCRMIFDKHAPEKTELIDDFPDARIIFEDAEKSERVEKISIETIDDETKSAVKAALTKAKIREGEEITPAKYSLFLQKLKEAMIESKISVTLQVAARTKNGVTLKIISDEKPAAFLFKATDAIDDEAVKELSKVLEEIFSDNPQLAYALAGNPQLMMNILAADPDARNLPFTPIVAGFEKEENEFVFSIKISREKPQVIAVYDDGFYAYAAAKGKNFREAGERDLAIMNMTLSGAKNWQELIYLLQQTAKRAMRGTDFSERFYLTFEESANADGGIALVIERMPVPENIVLSGDLPEYETNNVKKIIEDALHGEDEGATPEIAVKKAENYLKSKGYFVKSSQFAIALDGALNVRIDLRRWDELAVIQLDGNPTDDDEQTAKMIEELFAPLLGSYIKQEKLTAIKKQLARALQRSDVIETIGTNPETSSTRVIFYADIGEKKHAASLKLNTGYSGTGDASLVLGGKFGVSNNGKMESYTIEATSYTDFGFFKSWSTKDLTYESLSLSYQTATGQNSAVSVTVYGSYFNTSENKTATGGARSYYTRYLLDDKLVIKGGGALELVKNEGDSAYNDTPIRAKPEANICYSDGGAKICLNNSSSVGAANYYKPKASVTFSIPLGSSKKVFVKMGAALGAIAGNAPRNEELSRIDVGGPFALPIVGPAVKTGNFFAGAYLELSHVVTNGIMLKYAAASMRAVGSSVSATTGSCVGVGPIEICGGYEFGLANAGSGIIFSIGMSDIEGIPDEVKDFFSMIFLNSQMGE